TKFGAGLRIAEVHAADAMGNVTVKKYSYPYGDGVHSSGIIGTEPKYGYGISEYDPVSQQLLCAWYARTTTSRIPLGGGPVVGYSDVIVYYGASGEFGRTHARFVAVG